MTGQWLGIELKLRQNVHSVLHVFLFSHTWERMSTGRRFPEVPPETEHSFHTGGHDHFFGTGAAQDELRGPWN